MARAEPVARETAASRRWLSIIGIGEDGIAGLSEAAREQVASAEIVFGGKRHIALAASLIRGAGRCWPSPFERAVEEVLAQVSRVLADAKISLMPVSSFHRDHILVRKKDLPRSVRLLRQFLGQFGKSKA